jgi:hypothetical protein
MIDRTNSGQYKNMNRVKKVIKNGYTFKLYNKYWEKAKMLEEKVSNLNSNSVSGHPSLS